MDWNGPLPAEDERDAVEVPDTDCRLCDADQAELQCTISPFGPSENDGIDLLYPLCNKRSTYTEYVACVALYIDQDLKNLIIYSQ